jgi:hypothetical protein
MLSETSLDAKVVDQARRSPGAFFQSWTWPLANDVASSQCSAVQCDMSGRGVRSHAAIRYQ